MTSDPLKHYANLSLWLLFVLLKSTSCYSIQYLHQNLIDRWSGVMPGCGSYSGQQWVKSLSFENGKHTLAIDWLTHSCPEYEPHL